MKDLEKLFGNGLLKGLSSEEALAFLGRCRKNSYDDGTNLFKEQTEATRLYLIVEGGIDLRFEMPFREIPSSTITSSGPGDAIGWSAIVPPHLYRLSGYCRGKTVVLEIDRDALQEVFATNYHLAFIVMRNIAELAGARLFQVQDKLARVLGEEVIHGW
jgi:CRP-like cAMP-binding protein